MYIAATFGITFLLMMDSLTPKNLAVGGAFIGSYFDLKGTPSTLSYKVIIDPMDSMTHEI